MCNYGFGHSIPANVMVQSVQQGLASIKVPVKELMISPSGSMLDPIEVPEQARQGIYALANAYPAESFFIETRPETVTTGTVEELVSSVQGKRLGVELGLESSNEWIARFCINRSHGLDSFQKAVMLLRRHGVVCYGNTSLGTIFLTPQEAIQDAVSTVRWILDVGADMAVLFPLHVKPYTLLDELVTAGLMEPPSLWALVEVLVQCAEEAGRLEISWYKSYYDDPSKIRYSPVTCPQCQHHVISLLDWYRKTQAREAIQALNAQECACRDRWRKNSLRSEKRPLADRVFEAYEVLARRLGLDTWWVAHADNVKGLLTSPNPFGDMNTPTCRMEPS